MKASKWEFFHLTKINWKLFNETSANFKELTLKTINLIFPVPSLYLPLTNCAVLAATSFDATTSSSNFPPSCTTLSAASLRKSNKIWKSNKIRNSALIHFQKSKKCSGNIITRAPMKREIQRCHSHKHFRTPSHSFRGRDEAFSPSVMSFVELLGWSGTLKKIYIYIIAMVCMSVMQEKNIGKCWVFINKLFEVTTKKCD